MRQAKSQRANPQNESRFLKVGECLYRHKSSSVYYALAKRGGKQFRKSLKTTDRKLAERKLADFRGNVGKLKPVKRSKEIVFEKVADAWLASLTSRLKPSSLRRREVSVQQLEKHFRGLPIRDIHPADCDVWAGKRSPMIAASTFNNERETLRSIFAYAIREGLLLDNPSVQLQRRRVQAHKPIIPTREQFAELLRELRSSDPRYFDALNLVELLGHSGMRLGEATELRWEDVDFERGHFMVTGGETGTKNHETRVVPLFPAMRACLERLKLSVENPVGKIIPITTAKKALATASKKANLPHFTHHCLRHYFCSNAIEAGVDFKTIAEWLGHKDGGILVAQTYGHLRASHSFEMAKRMEG